MHLLGILLFLIFGIINTNLPTNEQEIILRKVNAIRNLGCKCGSKEMPPVPEVIWSKTLYQSALLHGMDMDKHNFFGHYSSKGKDIGDRLDKLGYYWLYVGENLGEGQNTFDEVLTDWLASPSHCEMLLNPNMKEMGVARYKRFWVQHFGTQVPPNVKRVRTY